MLGLFRATSLSFLVFVAEPSGCQSSTPTRLISSVLASVSFEVTNRKWKCPFWIALLLQWRLSYVHMNQLQLIQLSCVHKRVFTIEIIRVHLNNG